MMRYRYRIVFYVGRYKMNSINIPHPLIYNNRIVTYIVKLELIQTISRYLKIIELLFNVKNI